MITVYPKKEDLTDVKENIPMSAVAIRYCYGPHKGIYFVWWTGHSGKWQWSACGNTGEEESRELAQEKARQWIVSDRIK